MVSDAVRQVGMGWTLKGFDDLGQWDVFYFIGK